jgi:hypothetical protein
MKPEYILYSIEFQKRGLPHAHILVKYPFDCILPNDIDSVISAELPSNMEDRDLVLRFMMHSHPRSGRIPPYCQKRNDDTVCRFRYPQPLAESTVIDSSGRPTYRRRQECDRMVVPFNIQLLRKFNCHINFELAGSSQLFQYLFKYIHKG